MGDLVDRATERPTVLGTLRVLAHYRELVRNLVLRDLKLKYRGSALGFLWSLVNPIAMVSVYAFAFTYILRTSIEGFVFFLLLGVLAWNFFASSAMMSTGAIVDSGSMMRSVVFPRAILPIATVIFNLAQYLLTWLVLLPVILVVYRVPLAAPMLLFPVILALQVMFTIGVALLLAVATTYYRDMKHLLELGLALLFWLTPIVYALPQVADRFRPVVILSPLSPFIVSYQQIFYYRQWPDGHIFALAVTYGVAALAIGTWTFLSLEDELSERL